MTPTPAPNDDVSVNVYYTANGNNLKNAVTVDAVREKEYIWNLFFSNSVFLSSL